jgi:regulator of protease activity HflC (stomatin/prohibitin superfamily)
VICISLVAVIIVVTAILIAISFASLDYNEYGLDYNSFTKTIDPVPYTNGRYLLGIGHSFLVFPRAVQTMEFSFDRSADGPPLYSRTEDGLEVIIEISFQYHFMPEKLYDVYMLYVDNYNQVLRNVAMDVLTDMATHYTAYNFFMDRQKIGTEMQEKLNAVLTEV